MPRQGSATLPNPHHVQARGGAVWDKAHSAAPCNPKEERRAQNWPFLSSSNERSIQAVCSCTVRRWVSKSAVGSSLALSARGTGCGRCGPRLHGLRPARAPCPVPWAAWRGVRHSGQLAKLGIRARRHMAQRADALGDRIHRVPQLGVLRHEHGVQRVEHGARHIPVEVVGGEVTGCRCRPAGATGPGRWQRGLCR